MTAHGIEPDVGVSEPVKLTKSAEQVLKKVKANPSITIDALTMEIGISRETVKRALKILRDNGYIKRTGSDRLGHYEILK